MNSLRAKLLVATPLLPDDNFHRTVVLLIEHNEDGALGVVLNRPRQVGGAEAVAHWADRLQPPGLLHEGGPVSANSVIGLARGPDHGPEGLVPLYADIGVLDLHRDPDDLPDIGSVRLFAGYAGYYFCRADLTVVPLGTPVNSRASWRPDPGSSWIPNPTTPSQPTRRPSGDACSPARMA